MAWINSIRPEDDRFHTGDDSPWWNESSFITFRIPERKLLGILYFFFRPNLKVAMGGPWIVDPSGDELSTCLHSGWGWNMPIPDGADMFDVALPNGLTLETIEPLMSYRHIYKAVGCEFDLTFSADRAPQAMKSSEDKANEGLSEFVGDVAAEVKVGHFEQSGVMNGTLLVNGERIDVVDAATLRDRSWGPRPLVQSMNKSRGALVFARHDADNCFQAWFKTSLPWETDPLLGTSEALTHGWYVKDGLVSDLVSGVHRVVERGPDGRPLREIVEATDQLGRKLYAEGRPVCHLKLHAIYGDIVSFWYYANWTFDGHLDAPGEVQEWIMARLYSRWRKELLAAKAR